MTIGKRIKAWRENWQPSMTQADVAQRVGVTAQAVWLWESDRCEPTYAHLEEFVRVRGISMQTFWGSTPKAVAA